MAFIQSLKQFTLIFFFSWVMVHYFLNEPELVKSFGELMIEENNHANKRVQQARQYFDRNQITAQAEAQVQQNTHQETSDHANQSQQTVGQNKSEAIEQNHNVEHHQDQAPLANESHEAPNKHSQSVEQNIDNKPQAETTETKQPKQTQAKRPASSQQQRQQQAKKQTNQQNPQQKQQKTQSGAKIPAKKQPTKKKGEAPLEDQ